MDQPEGIRINKFLSEIGYCSRRAADKLIEQRRVKINGQVPEMGTRVTKQDEVSVDGKVVSGGTKEDRVYLAFHKPVGIVCTTDTRVEKDNIIDYIGYPTRIFPIGRLDKPSEGLIFLTNDGDIVNKILRARNGHEKEYQVVVNKPITKSFIRGMAGGVPILDTVTRKCKVTQTSTYGFTIVLTQGLNRQIRRMCEHFGYNVQRLKRVRIMNVGLDVPVGQYRDLTQAELAEIERLASASSKTEDASYLDEPLTERPAQAPRPHRTSRPASGAGPRRNAPRGPSVGGRGGNQRGNGGGFKGRGRGGSKPSGRPPRRR